MDRRGCDAVIERQTAEITMLKQTVDALCRCVFGKSSEQLDPAQLELFEPAKKVPAADPADHGPAVEDPERRDCRRKGPRPPRIPEHLPVIEQVLDPPEVVANPEQWRRIGEEVREQLDYKRTEFRRIRLIRGEYVRKGDESANPAYVAADLLAQAEHGHDGEVILVSTSSHVIEAVREQIEKQVAEMPRADIIRGIIERGTWLVKAMDLDEAIGICNRYAPEHLSLIVKDEAAIIPRIRNVGAIFLGNCSPVATGDFVAGPSHTLPTGGAGKSFSGLTVDQFQRRTSLVKFDRPALEKTAPLVIRFGEIEGLYAHARTASIRLE